MSDYMAAEIWIGGRIPAALVPNLCLAISRECAGIEWGDCKFSPTTADALRPAIREHDGVPALWLCDDQARWGQFEELEAFLVTHGIQFRRRSDGKFDSDPEIVEFRAGTGLVHFATNSSGEPLVPLVTLTAVERMVEKSLARSARCSVKSLTAKLRAIRRLLRKHLPPAIPPLQ